MEEQRQRNRVVEKQLRKRVVGGHNKQIDTVVNWFPSHEQGDIADLLDEMLVDRSAPVERYGGTREAIRLTSVASAISYLRDNGGNVPFGFD